MTAGGRASAYADDMSGRTARRRVLRLTLPAEAGQAAGGAARSDQRADLLAVEEPLGIRVDGTALTMTMRTPGNDVELAAGFLVSEAVVAAADDIADQDLQRCLLRPR